MLTSEQKLLRGLIEDEIRSNSMYSLDGKKFFNEKHVQLYKRFFNKYSGNMDSEKHDGEKTIDFITRIGMLEELYQIALAENGKYEMNEYLKIKRNKEEEHLNQLRREREKEEAIEQEEKKKQEEEFEQFKKYVYSIAPSDPNKEDKDKVICPNWEFIENYLFEAKKRFFPKYKETKYNMLVDLGLDCELLKIIEEYFNEHQIDFNNYNSSQRIDIVSNIIQQLIHKTYNND